MSQNMLDEMRGAVRTLSGELHHLDRITPPSIDLSAPLMHVGRTERWLNVVAAAGPSGHDLQRIDAGFGVVSEAQRLVTDLVRLSPMGTASDTYQRNASIVADLPGNDPTDY